MFEILIKDYPVITLTVLFFVWMLVKNKIFATPSEIKDVKKKIIDELLEKNVFVTPAQMQQVETNLKAEFENKYLMLRVWEEFKKGIEIQFSNIFKRFDENTEQTKSIFKGINDLKSYLMNNKNE